tara:strand:- start:456 stop:797 length:342 start_codon:yes stop_codon:yes gene_type:complete
MPCGTVRGSALTFGLDNDEASLTTQSISVTNKSDKKEARDKCGIVVSVAYYNFTTEISLEGLGTSIATGVGAAISLAGSYAEAGTTYIDEITIDHANEEFRKVSVKMTSYAGI